MEIYTSKYEWHEAKDTLKICQFTLLIKSIKTLK